MWEGTWERTSAVDLPLSAPRRSRWPMPGSGWPGPATACASSPSAIPSRIASGQIMRRTWLRSPMPRSGASRAVGRGEISIPQPPSRPPAGRGRPSIRLRAGRRGTGCRPQGHVAHPPVWSRPVAGKARSSIASSTRWACPLVIGSTSRPSPAAFSPQGSASSTWSWPETGRSVKWSASVGFTTTRTRAIWGHAGFLNYFTATFDGRRKSVRLDPNDTFPPRLYA